MVSALLPRGTDKVCQYLVLGMPIISHAQASSYRVLHFLPLKDMTATDPRSTDILNGKGLASDAKNEESIKIPQQPADERLA